MEYFKKIWEVLIPEEKNKSLILLLVLIVSMLMEVLGIGIFLPFMSALIDNELFKTFPVLKNFDYFNNINDRTSLIISLTLLLCFVFFIKNLFLIFSTWLKAKYLADFNRRLSYDLFKLYLLSPYNFHIKNNSSKLIHNCSVVVNTCKEAIGFSLVLFSELIVSFGILCLLFIIQPVAVLITITISLILAFFYIKINRSRLIEWGKTIQFSEKIRLQHLMQGLGSIKILKLLGNEDEFLKKFENFNKKVNKFLYLSNTLINIPKFILEFFGVVIITILLVYLVSKNSTNEEILLILGIFGVSAIRILPAITRIINALERLSLYKYSVDTVYNEFNQSKTINEKIDRKQISLSKGFSEFEIKDLSFKYEGAKDFALLDINFKINSGSYLGIIGNSGSGKTTFVDILSGLLKPYSGKIFLDKKNITNEMNIWKNKIGYVPQNIYLTDDTLRSNIAFGVPEEKIDNKKIFKIIEICELSDFVNNLKDNINEILGERGVKISGGEKQRIGIARALYHDPEVLIFDEFTSSLDEDTEKSILQNLKKLKKNKTIISISHKNSTLVDCEKIITFKKGKIIN
tara:strand:+ start:6035 stop:7756 length:1722 start_codon:yes stop_codon:yes gene_type:complete